MNSVVDYKYLEQMLSKVEGWYSTWYTDSNQGKSGVGGLVATLWGSSWFAVMPHVLNVAPVVIGMCYRDIDDQGILAHRVENLLEFLVNSQDKDTGIFLPSWGDIPYKKTGLIHQSITTSALWMYFKKTKDKEILKYSMKAMHTLKILKDESNVVNQILKYLETVIDMCDALETKNCGEFTKELKYLGKYILSLQFTEGEIKGAFPQSLADDNIYTPYQGKCIQPLLKLGLFLSDNLYIESALKLSRFIKDKLLIDFKNGLLIVNGILAYGKYKKFWEKGYKIRRFFPIMEKYLRVRRIQSIDKWIFSKYPMWIARQADTMLGFYKLFEITQEKEWINLVFDMIKIFKLYQTPLGGIRNTLGFFGSLHTQSLVWQDVAPITRWNAYVIKLLHYILRNRKPISPNIPDKNLKDRVLLNEDQLYEETPLMVRLWNLKTNETEWIVKKSQRWGRPRIPYSNWNEGGSVRF